MAQKVRAPVALAEDQNLIPITQRVANNLITPVLGDLVPSSSLCRQQAGIGEHLQACTQNTHAQIKNKSIFKRLNKDRNTKMAKIYILFFLPSLNFKV